MKNTSKEWINAFEALIENYVQPTILLSATLTFHFKNKIKTFSDKYSKFTSHTSYLSIHSSKTRQYTKKEDYIKLEQKDTGHQEMDNYEKGRCQKFILSLRKWKILRSVIKTNKTLIKKKKVQLRTLIWRGYGIRFISAELLSPHPQHTSPSGHGTRLKLL